MRWWKVPNIYILGINRPSKLTCKHSTLPRQIKAVHHLSLLEHTVASSHDSAMGCPWSPALALPMFIQGNEHPHQGNILSQLPESWSHVPPGAHSMDWHKKRALCWLPPISVLLPYPSLGFLWSQTKQTNCTWIFVSGLALEGTQTKMETRLELGSNILDGKTSFNITH